MSTHLFTCLGVRIFAVMLAFAGFGDVADNVRAHLESEQFALHKELFVVLEKGRKELEATMRATMPDAPRPSSQPLSVENIEQIKARMYGGRLYAVIAFSSAGVLIGLLLFCWPSKVARSVSDGLAESLDPVSAMRCLLRLVGMYFVLSTFLAFMAVSLTSTQLPLLQFGVEMLLPFGIHFGFGIAILLCDRWLARLCLWKLG